MSEPSSPDPSHSRFCCPQCGSDSTQKLSAVYETGTSQINTESSHGGVALSGGRLVPIAGGSSTSGTQQTEIAKKAAPPPKAGGIGCMGPLFLAIGVPVIWWFVLAVTLFSLGAGTDDDVLANAFWLMFIVTVLPYYVFLGKLGRKRYLEMQRYNTEVWPGLMVEWERKWLCHRCGQEFVPELASSGKTD